jgi:hypothetical protein
MLGGAVSARPEFPSAGSIHSSRPLFGPAFATLAVLLGLAASWPSAAAADPTYGVMNAPEGVYWRSEPNWAAAVRVTGFGVYNGTVVEVHCYQSGTSVEGSADTMWEQATDVGGPGYGSGWLNEHFINDGQPINEHSPGVPPCGSTPAPPPSPPAPAPAGGGLVFSVFNAEGGIYYRYGPHWLETTSTPGVGVYDGDQVELICGAFGDAVGPYADTAWSKVRNLSRSVGEGWVNEHFINDGAPDNGFVSGEPMCQPGSSGSSGGGSGGGTGTSTPAPPTALYYSPYTSKNHGPGGAPSGALTMWDDEWDRVDPTHGAGSNQCPAPQFSRPASQSITTLAAWSKARSAPFLLLQSSSTWLQRIHYILLFDPGTQAELDNSPCDEKYQMGMILRKWLLTNSQNRLVILSGEVTADSDHVTEQGLGHAGIQDTYFTPLKVAGDKYGQAPRTQIVVCNYDTMSHQEVWTRYGSWITKPPITLGSCPPWPGHKVVAWNP